MNLSSPVNNSTPSKVLRIKKFASKTFDRNFSKTTFKDAPACKRLSSNELLVSPSID